MIQRIQELLQEATDNILGVSVVDQEKFAQLIVRECATYMNEFADNGDQRNGNDLLKHFGVEE